MGKFQVEDCRICFSSTYLENVGESSNSSALYDQLMYAVPEIDWSANDHPSKICRNCNNKVKEFTNFKLQCVQSEFARQKFMKEHQKRKKSIHIGCEKNAVFSDGVVLSIPEDSSLDDNDLIICNEISNVNPKSLDLNGNSTERDMIKVKRKRKRLKHKTDFHDNFKVKKAKLAVVSEKHNEIDESANEISLIEPCLDDLILENIEVNPSIDHSLSEQLRDIDLHIKGSNESLHKLSSEDTKTSSYDTKLDDSDIVESASKKTVSIINPEEFLNIDIDNIECNDVENVHCVSCNIKFSTPDGLKIHLVTVHKNSSNECVESAEKQLKNQPLEEGVVSSNETLKLNVVDVSVNDPALQKEDVDAFGNGTSLQKEQDNLIKRVLKENTEKGRCDDSNVGFLLVTLHAPSENIQDVEVCSEQISDCISEDTDNLGCQIITAVEENLGDKPLCDHIGKSPEEICKSTTESFNHDKRKLFDCECGVKILEPVENSLKNIAEKAENHLDETIIILNSGRQNSVREEITISDEEIHLLCENIETNITNSPESCKKTTRYKRNKGENKKSLKSLDGYPEPKYMKCNICGNEYASQKYLDRHLKSHKNQNVWLCDICGKTCTSSNNLVHHKERHKTELKYECKECPLKYRTANSLHCHIKLKHSEKKFKCPCGYLCSSASYLKLHMRRHNKDFKFNCHICNKGFIAQYELNRHMSVHDIKCYVCETCDEQFDNVRAYSKHKKTHEENDKKIGRPVYECDICKLKTFTSDAELEKHENEHTANGQVKSTDSVEVNDLKKCIFCRKTFSSYSVMINHMPSHGKQVSLQCRICNKTFPYMSMCVTHLQMQHSIKVKQQKLTDFFILNLSSDA